MNTKKANNQYTKIYNEGEELKRVTPLKDMPLDVRKHVLDTQGVLKSKKGTSQFSMASTIYHIIREHKKINEKPIMYGGLKN